MLLTHSQNDCNLREFSKKCSSLGFPISHTELIEIGNLPEASQFISLLDQLITTDSFLQSSEYSKYNSILTDDKAKNPSNCNLSQTIQELLENGSKSEDSDKKRHNLNKQRITQLQLEIELFDSLNNQLNQELESICLLSTQSDLASSVNEFSLEKTSLDSNLQIFQSSIAPFLLQTNSVDYFGISNPQIQNYISQELFLKQEINSSNLKSSFETEFSLFNQTVSVFQEELTAVNSIIHNKSKTIVQDDLTNVLNMFGNWIDSHYQWASSCNSCSVALLHVSKLQREQMNYEVEKFKNAVNIKDIENSIAKMKLLLHKWENTSGDSRDSQCLFKTSFLPIIDQIESLIHRNIFVGLNEIPSNSCAEQFKLVFSFYLHLGN